MICDFLLSNLLGSNYVLHSIMFDMNLLGYNHLLQQMSCQRGLQNYVKDWYLMNSQSNFLFLTYFYPMNYGHIIRRI